MRLQIRTWETNGLYVMLLYQLQCDIASKRGGVYREPTSELPGDGVRVDVGLLMHFPGSYIPEPRIRITGSEVRKSTFQIYPRFQNSYFVQSV